MAANNGGDLSSVVIKELTPNVIGSIADFLRFTPTTATRINAPVTIIYKNGRNMYIKDANDTFILAYNLNDVVEVAELAAVNGDQLASITGTYATSGGLPELVPSAIGEKTSGTAVDPYEVNISDITPEMLNQYVTFGLVKIEAMERANNYTATDADGNTITLYNTFNNSKYYDVVEVPEGEDFMVTGFVGIYNGTLQITPVAITGGKVIETVATPVFSVASGVVEEGTQVEITCETEGATIYYTVDESTPSAENGVEYTGPLPITDAVVIKAIAVKAECYDSEVATATYIIRKEGAGEATFVFCDEANGFNLTPAIEFPTESSTSVQLHEKSFTNGAITITFDKGTNTNNGPVFFYPTGASTKGQLEARIYVDNTISFVCNGGVITRVTFEQWGNSNTWAGFTTKSEGFDEISATDRTFTCPEGIQSFVLSSTKTSRFKSITVEYNTSGTGAIDGVITDGEADAPVEFYNLQGIRVDAANLAPGIYVARQGSKVMKVYVK